MVRITNANDNTLSLEKVLSIRSEAFAQLRWLADQIATLGTALEAVDAALQVQMVNRSSDEQQALVTAARALAEVLNGTDQFEQLDHEAGIAGELAAGRSFIDSQSLEEILELPRMASGGVPW